MKAHHITDVYDIAAAGLDSLQLRQYYEHLIAPVYPAQFPQNFRLAPQDWYLAPELVRRPPAVSCGQLIRPIGTMDVEFLSGETLEQARSQRVSLDHRYPCGMKCPGCFSQDDTYSDPSRLLTWNEVFGVIDDARTIGLRSIKFLGPGELFQNPDLFQILDAAEERHLPLSIFTKGAELGDDELTNCIYGHQGVHSAAQLVSRIKQYSCVRILLGFNSFDPHKQDLMVGSQGVTGHYRVRDGMFEKRGVPKYTEKRNRALVHLVRAGFNDPDGGQRLSLIAAPVGLDQIDEIPNMYIWAARRNIPLIIAPTMESGPKAIGLMKFNNKQDPAHQRLIQMYLAVYSRAIDEGVITVEQMRASGISAYMGTAPCNQVANGLYLRLNGQIQMCPGNSDKQTRLGNVYEKSIIDIWRESENYRIGAVDNNWCRAKTNGMPPWLQKEVETRLAVRYAAATLTRTATTPVVTYPYVDPIQR